MDLAKKSLPSRGAVAGKMRKDVPASDDKENKKNDPDTEYRDQTADSVDPNGVGAVRSSNECEDKTDRRDIREAIEERAGRRRRQGNGRQAAEDPNS